MKKSFSRSVTAGRAPRGLSNSDMVRAIGGVEVDAGTLEVANDGKMIIRKLPGRPKAGEAVLT
jgi:hypothetical protein